MMRCRRSSQYMRDPGGTEAKINSPRVQRVLVELTVRSGPLPALCGALRPPRSRRGCLRTRMGQGAMGLIPTWSPTKTPMNTQCRRLSTVNARSKDVAAKPTYRDALKRGQRCIISADSLNEPNWETGKNE